MTLKGILITAALGIVCAWLWNKVKASNMTKRNDLLIYGVEYDLYRDGEHIGSAVWTDDENIGEAFIKEQDDGSYLVFTNIDEWEIKYKSINK